MSNHEDAVKKSPKESVLLGHGLKEEAQPIKINPKGGRNGHKSLCTHRKASVTPQATARRDLARGRVRPQNPQPAGAEHPGQVGRAPGGRKAPVEGRSCWQPHERVQPSRSPASSSSPPPQPRTRHRDHQRAEPFAFGYTHPGGRPVGENGKNKKPSLEPRERQRRFIKCH